MVSWEISACWWGFMNFVKDIIGNEFWMSFLLRNMMRQLRKPQADANFPPVKCCWHVCCFCFQLLPPVDFRRLGRDLRVYCRISSGDRLFVLESRCSKDLCIRIFPEVSRFNCVMEVDEMIDSEGASSSKVLEWENLEREHRIYTQLALELMGSPTDESCVSEPISASSTDNYPEESIIYTLDPRDREDDRADGPLYWSSKGESDRGIPETLTYRLSTNLCVVHEVKIRPFQAYFQMGCPIYSANAVRFRFGHSNSSLGLNASQGFMSNSRSTNDEYVWTYISPEFPMQQEDKLQTFKLPRPILCIGGILQIELLGRVQKQEMDGLYYICVCHVHVVGRPLHLFDFATLGELDQYILKYSEKSKQLEPSRAVSEDTEAGASSGWHSFAERIRHIRAGRVFTLLGIAVATYDLSNDQDSDEEADVDLFI